MVIPLMSDTWPVRRQTYGYLPSRKASPPIGWYQIILLGDRGTHVLTTCPGLHSIAERPGFELATYWSQVQRPNHSATEPHIEPGSTRAGIYVSHWWQQEDTWRQLLVKLQLWYLDRQVWGLEQRVNDVKFRRRTLGHIKIAVLWS